MAERYNPQEIEPHWQAVWERDGLYQTHEDPERPKWYALTMFVYPSGDIHAGHWYAFTPSDTAARWRRMNGYNVFFPVGFDAFGLPAENAAIKHNIHPKTWTYANIERMRRQLRSMGAMWAWDHELVTCDPRFYRWTQWLFLRLYEVGLAYRDEAAVDWCPGCNTTLAREQVWGPERRCERCRTQVVQKTLIQWKLRITAYADELLAGLETLEWPEPVKAMQRNWIGRKTDAQGVTYRLHDWLISRQRMWGAPIPIIYCPACGVVPVPDAELPVRLPDDAAFAPTGVSPLKAHAGFRDVACPHCGGAAERETDTLDTFFCSSWYQYAYVSPNHRADQPLRRDDLPWNAAAGTHWLPVNQYTGGIEHATMHLLYTRFMTRAMRDLGLVQFDEPMQRLFTQGMILGPDGEKMSKSRGNVINPDQFVQRYGADTVRGYMMFIGPWDQGGPWDPRAIEGVHRFLHRVWNLVVAEPAPETETRTPLPAEQAQHLERNLNQLVKHVTADLAAFRFHTAIAQLMAFTNLLVREQVALAGDPARRLHTLRIVLLLMAPFFPFISEELWCRLGHTTSIHLQAWPAHNAHQAEVAYSELMVQINGKNRGTVHIASDSDHAAIAATAQALPTVQAQLAGKAIKKVIVVPQRLVNFVVY